MVHLYRRRFPVAQSAEQIFNAMLRDAKHVNHTRAKLLKRSLDAAKAELASAQKSYAAAPSALKPARQLAVRRATLSVSQVQQDMVELVKKSGVRVIPAASPVKPLPQQTALVGKPRRVASQAQAQMANQIKAQRIDLLKAKQEVFNAKTPADKIRAEKTLLDRAQRLAILVPGKRRKTSALVKVSAGVAKVEKSKLIQKIRELRAKIAQKQGALQAAGGAQPTATILRIQINRLQTELQSAERRLALINRGVIRRRPQQIPPSGVRVPRPRIPQPSPDVAPSPLSVQQALASLISSLPKKVGESAEAYRNRLEAYLQRVIARLISLLAAGQDEASALQDATTQTLTEDSSALEAEAASGGVAADAAAESVADIVDGAAGPALDTIEEQVAQSQAVDTANVDELIVQAEGAEAQLAEGTTPVEYTAASDTNASVEQAAAQEAVASGSAAAQSGSEGFYEQAAEKLANQQASWPDGIDPALISYAPQAPAAADAPVDYTLPTVEGKPFWKHPVVIGGVALTGLFLLLRR
jgi:hypothetical protein